MRQWNRQVYIALIYVKISSKETMFGIIYRALTCNSGTFVEFGRWPLCKKLTRLGQVKIKTCFSSGFSKRNENEGLFIFYFLFFKMAAIWTFRQPMCFPYEFWRIRWIQMMSMGALRQSFKGRNQMAFDLQRHQLAISLARRATRYLSP